MKTLMTVFVVSGALGALAVTYDATTDWASVSSAGYADGTGDLTAAHGWTNTAGAATVKGEVILVDDEETGGELVYGPSAPQAVNEVQTIYSHFPTVEVGEEPDEPASATLADISAVGYGAMAKWHGWCESGWVSLTGTVPDGACDIRIELDNRTASRLVRYSVKTTGDFIPLTTSEHADGWLPAAASDKKCISQVAFSGKTALTGVELTQTGTVTVDDTRLAKSGITAAQLGENGANGNPNWENLVLGLDCKDASSKPVVQPMQTSDADTVTLALGGVNIDTSSGATVSYRVRAYDDEGEKATSAYVAAATPTAMALPSSGVRYYQMEVVTTPSK